jgi:hypothetical protein
MLSFVLSLKFIIIFFVMGMIRFHCPSGACHVCNRDDTLARLKSSLIDAQLQLREHWKAADVVQVDDFLLMGERGVGMETWFLLGEKGPMVIPSYESYDRQWAKAYFKNPLESDWQSFDIHSSNDVEYLVAMVEVLEDQRDMWVYDADTNEQAIMGVLERFRRALKRLLMFCFTLGYLK